MQRFSESRSRARTEPGSGSVSLDEILHDVRTDGPPPMAAAVSVLFEVSDALARAHASGVVHGALRPTAIVVDEGGHSRLHGFDIGSRGDAAAAAPDDVFSLGAIAYELLTARPLCDDSSEAEVRHYIGSRATPPSRVNPACPPELDRAIQTALAPEGAARPASAVALCRVLASLGGANPSAVAAWLHAASEDTFADAVAAADVLDDPDRAEPPYSPRLARGSGRLPSAPVAIHEAATVLRAPTPTEDSERRLPIVAPPEPYLVLEVEDDTDVPIVVQRFERPDDDVAHERPVAAEWPAVAPCAAPIARTRRLPRSAELALAFCAGALAMWLIVVALG